jgi:polar amino acid transport system permease protein
MKFDVEIVIKSMPMLLKGALFTIQLSLLGILIGVVIGISLAFFRLSNRKILDLPTRIFINFIRGVPFFIQILIIYYSFAGLGFKIPAFIGGVIAMALNTAAFQAETWRAGIQSIHRGQTEAAHALGLTSIQTFRRITLPQVTMKVLPSITNEFIILLKNSSLVSVIGVVELTRTGQQIVSTSYRPAEIYITVAIMYLVMNLLIAQFAKYFEKRGALYR